MHLNFYLELSTRDQINNDIFNCGNGSKYPFVFVRPDQSSRPKLTNQTSKYLPPGLHERGPFHSPAVLGLLMLSDTQKQESKSQVHLWKLLNCGAADWKALLGLATLAKPFLLLPQKLSQNWLKSYSDFPNSEFGKSTSNMECGVSFSTVHSLCELSRCKSGVPLEMSTSLP